MTEPQLDHAVVIGGSMAGLAAAGVLRDHCRRVTLIDRDRFPDEAGPRKGVPQARHLHVLLPSGLEVLGRLFPRLPAELLAAGASRVTLPADALWLSPAGWSKRFPRGIEILSCSRDLVDWAVRRELVADSRVRILQGSDVVGLLAGGPSGSAGQHSTDSGGRVAGVRLRGRQEGAVGASTTELPADLVVDASGRASRAPQWAAELGYDPPQETRISADLGYATRTYRIPPGFDGDWKVLFLQAKPPGRSRTGFLFPIEGDRWRVSMMGAGGDHPPTDEAGFLDFARSLRSPVLYDTIRDLEPLTPIYGHRGTTNQRRHYERLRRWPEGFVVTGDAACAFNPIYGQGMSVAAMEAMTLDACLHEQRRRGRGVIGLSRRFHRRAAKRADPAWLLATGEDLRYPTTTGAKATLRVRLMHRYLDRVTVAAGEHADVNLAFVSVLGLTAPPTALFAPGVISAALRGRGAPVACPPPATAWPEPTRTVS